MQAALPSMLDFHRSNYDLTIAVLRKLIWQPRNVVSNDMRPSLLRDASVEASPESSHFPVAWPGLTPEGRRSACVKQSSGTRRQGQGSGNQETSTAASPTPRHPSSPEQPRLARAGCSCEHARPDLGWRPAHPRHNPKFLSRPEPWEGADRYHVSHAKVV